MLNLLNTLASICIIIGLFFMVVAAIGLVRFPDFYSRAHACGKCDTLGEGMMLLGFILYEGASLVSVKLLLLIIFIFVTSPTALHAIMHFAYTSGVKPWKKGDARE
ncbi:MAG TPA: monovalent cation/H(+) antiporter subunit G [Candidatus Methanoculleus thermohydrogenotrophicum]|nr:monovalent cation/H(+) antiporter subunit G [Candidatus Methanoculleus thermohydrogenotrophicum]HOB17193.1 monovalent cation/H(+) antiporter subunit G [Candidatus Methanoculleus thermohydrogenotrophicum]HPZ37272.1 monovalent cation/H(+) antiporter subunit G [Candidatus Methanoculleus thermohydrogenotrophicum]HQC90514.1 monovalent cation/H(+) antiporter subunit G [Candidatus Methanoculleus thermohydrogenotrophicum]